MGTAIVGIGDILFRTRPELLYRLDSGGALLGSNESAELENREAPLLHLFWREGLWFVRRRAGMPGPAAEAAGARIAQLGLDTEPSTAAVVGILRETGVFRGTRALLYCGPAYYFGQRIVSTTESTEVGAHNRDVLLPYYHYVHEHLDDLEPCFARVADGHAVSVCQTVRRSSVALECGVHTLPAFRGRGFGTGVVAAWGRSVQQSRLIACYSTNWSNRDSLAIAKHLNAVAYAVDFWVTEEDTERA